MALLLYAHPYPNRSRANRALVEAVRDIDGLRVHSLYDRYPDFDIDVARERAELERHEFVVWQHPMYWYSMPALLKHYVDRVLGRGWAYGEGGDNLAGKRCLWVTTTGGDASAFEPNGMHAHSFSAFVPPIEQTVRFCQMRWLPPLVVHAAHRLEPGDLQRMAADYRLRLERLMAAAPQEPT